MAFSDQDPTANLHLPCTENTERFANAIAILTMSIVT